jgi:hypothetical protein
LYNTRKNDIQIIVHQKPENTGRIHGTLGYPLQYVDPETKKHIMEDT